MTLYYIACNFQCDCHHQLDYLYTFQDHSWLYIEVAYFTRPFISSQYIIRQSELNATANWGLLGVFVWFGQWPTQLMKLGWIVITVVSIGICVSVGIDIIVICIQHSLSHDWCQWVHMWHVYWNTFPIKVCQVMWAYGYIWLWGWFVAGQYFAVLW